MTLWLSLILAAAPADERTSDRYLRQLDELSALWSRYEFDYVKDGRVVELDERGITTSEAQSYGMLRAVWQRDKEAFASIWRWTKENLRTRRDLLFAWKHDGRGVVDHNTASDADVDIALALIVASRLFEVKTYRSEALALIDDIWKQEVVVANGVPYLSAGNWASRERYVTIHVGYLAPASYTVFAEVDAKHDWRGLAASSYALLDWLQERTKLPPEIVYLDKNKNTLLLSKPGGKIATFGYDVVPLFFRLAVDAAWHGRAERSARVLLDNVEEIYATSGRLVERYDTNGHPLSQLEGLPHYASVHALALVEDRDFAERLEREKLAQLFGKALQNKETPYYLHNWLWFDRAFALDRVVQGNELFAFLRPFDMEGFLVHLPLAWVLATFVSFFLGKRFRAARVAFVVSGLALCARYLVWRLTTSLNFVETFGPIISIALWCAEAYSFTTVVLLVLQVGLWPREKPARPDVPSFTPSVDVLIPIYSESTDILDKTLIAAVAMRYANKKIWVCDDSHRDEVRTLAASHGAGYIKGPKKHAKAGNLNNAMTVTSGELVLVFDTDHIPVTSFLEETVSWFVDDKLAVVQTPHHFYNDDIFQRAFRLEGTVANEQDLFNHAIQNGRDGWGGAFFVGSGALFRRKALDENGGFNLLSITEDIHTSQHLHARGWRTRFVDKDLAVGLTAENLSSYLVQRRRWMLGCLQIFFKDNPILHRGLPLRLRLGYFASLYYFLHPLFRVIYWLTPLYFLFFHLHPLFADLPELLAYLMPAIIFLPMVSSALLPGWPRFGWGVVYELVVSFPLFRAMFDLFLPKSLGFKVTPKGIVSTKRSFDASSSLLTIIAALLTLAGIVKGYVEMTAFGIERDAYVLNIVWATVNLLGLAVALLVAWERPQRRVEERLRRTFKVRVDGIEMGATRDVSLSGCALEVTRSAAVLAMASEADLTLDMYDGPLILPAKRVYEQPLGGGRLRLGFRFVLGAAERRALLLALYAHPKSWERAHANEPRSNLAMFWHLTRGIARALLPALLVMGVCSSAHAEGIRESWYMMRGRSNMEIGNFKAAIEAYEKAVELNPDNADAMRSLGTAYEQQGLYDKAVEQYDKYLARFPDDTDVNFAQAQRLKWSRYGYRRKDAIRYYRQGLAKKDDPAMRLELAKLLAQDKKDVRAALDEYERLLDATPNDATLRRDYQKLLLWDEAQGTRAIPEYEKTWKERHDYETGRTLAELYARDGKYHDKAIATYSELVRMRPEDAKTRRAYAGLLARRAGTRKQALDEYERLTKAGDRESRIAYAGLLASDEDTLPQALELYHQAAKADGRDVRPRVGLARAYAAQGDRQRALEQARLARKLAPNDATVARLNYELEGRDGPAVTGKVTALIQPAGVYELYGFGATASGSLEVAGTVVAGLRAGGETYWSGVERASGAVVGAFAEVLVGEADLASARIDLHTLADAGLEVAASFDHRAGDLLLRPSVERTLRFDSYLALVGAEGRGAARSHLARVEARIEHDRLHAWVAPHLGFITANSDSSNLQLGAEGGAQWFAVADSTTRFGLGATTYLTHYGTDHGAFDGPLGDGYFSPDLFWSNALTASLSVRTAAHELRLFAGPALQYQKAGTTPGGVRFGGGGGIHYSYEILPKLTWESEADLTRTSNVYTRVGLSTRLVYAY